MDETMLLMHTGVILYMLHLALEQAQHCTLPVEQMAECQQPCEKLERAQRLLAGAVETYNQRRLGQPPDPGDPYMEPIGGLMYKPRKN